MTNAQFDGALSAHTTDDEVLDHEQFEEMRDLLEEDFVDLVQTYLTDSKQRITAIRTAYAADDNANGFEIAHALVGASANLGATLLVTLGRQLQEACRERQITQQGDCIEQINAALQRTQTVIFERLGL